MSETVRVVITGIGGICSHGTSVTEIEENIFAGKSGAAPISRFNSTSLKTHFACEIPVYDPINYFERKEIRKMDPFTQYALISARQAMQSSVVQTDQYNPYRCGVIWASGNGGVVTFEEQMVDYMKAEIKRFNPFFIPKTLIDSPCGKIAIEFGFKGLSYCPVAACASSTNAIIEAVMAIQSGRADLILCGGSEAPITLSWMGGFDAMKALSTQNENYLMASRPFDKNRDGFVVGEGGAAFVLERLDKALERGATILAEIKGGGITTDAFHVTATHPEGEGAAMSMKIALEMAGLQVSDIDYVNMHATSTDLGDLSEMNALKKVFKDVDMLHLSGTKSMTGHLLGASGAIEALICVLALNRNKIPPTINTTDVDIDLPKNMNLCLGQTVFKPLSHVLSNSFGFSGHNASLILSKV